MRAHRDRSRARGWALQVLYAADIRGDGEARHALEDFLLHRRIAPDSRPYLRELIGSVDSHRAELDAAIEAALTNWRLERLSAIDRNVLRIGATELLHGADVPPRVAIQESLRLAERFGTADSPRFVNGVLDALYRKREAADGNPHPPEAAV